MRNVNRSAYAIGPALLAASVLAQGCATQSATPQPTQPQFRQTTETAPADLQLICAEQSAQEFRVLPARSLPVASSTAGDGTYTVLVNADGTLARCVIDGDGNVLSLANA